MSLKQDVEKKLGIPVKLKAGMPGSMDVYLDGQRIFSKAQTGKMAQYSDIAPMIESRKRA